MGEAQTGGWGVTASGRGRGSWCRTARSGRVISLSPIPSPMSRMTLGAFPPWMAFLAAEVLSVWDPAPRAAAGRATAEAATARMRAVRTRGERLRLVEVRSQLG